MLEDIECHVVNYLFLDMNSYFASVAQQEEPHLRGRPVGIVTVDKPNAACIAASYEAKRFGIGMGTRKSDARRLCPAIEFRAARHDVYVDYHHRIIDATECIHPVTSVHSVDEFALRLTGRHRLLPEAIKLGEAIRAKIAHVVGPALQCSIGLGTSKLLAKMGTEMEKPNGMQWLVPQVMPGKLAGYALGDLPGIGKRMEQRLHDAGITDIETLYRLHPKHARKLWGNVTGERFLRALRGEDIPDVVTGRHSLGHGQILSQANRTPENARLVARRLLIKAATRLRRADVFAGSLHLSGKCTRDLRRHVSVKIAPTRDTFALLKHFARLWPSLELHNPAQISIMLGSLQSADAHTADLFEERTGPGISTDREHLCLVVDHINQRFGQDTVIYGEKPAQITPYSGAKIAFNRIPLQVEFRD